MILCCVDSLQSMRKSSNHNLEAISLQIVQHCVPFFLPAASNSCESTSIYVTNPAGASGANIMQHFLDEYFHQDPFDDEAVAFLRGTSIGNNHEDPLEWW